MWKYPITESKSKLKEVLKVTLFIVLLGFTIYLCFRNYKLSREVNSLEHSINEVPDTVYLDKPFKPEPKYSEDVQPVRILIYGDGSKSFSKKFAINSDSLSQPSISKEDSLVQLTLKKNQLNLSFLNQSSGTYSTRLFSIDLDKYSYNWYEGQLTQKKAKRLSLSPYVYGKYRPFNKLFDVGSGISIKTKRFNYKLGVNAFYYPELKSGIGTDLELSITYEF